MKTHRATVMTDTSSGGAQPTPSRSHAIAGLAMGSGAVLLWSLSSAGIVLAGKQVGVWQFLALTSSLGGAFQVIGYLALGRAPR